LAEGKLFSDGWSVIVADSSTRANKVMLWDFLRADSFLCAELEQRLFMNMTYVEVVVVAAQNYCA
jgi:hypothetical protein